MPPYRSETQLACALAVSALLLASFGAILPKSLAPSADELAPSRQCSLAPGYSNACSDPGASAPVGGPAATARSSPHPTAPPAPPPLAWFNQTTSMGTGPATLFGSLAFDPDLGGFGGEFVYFGGCLLPPSSCPTNVTWIYNGLSWSPSSSSKLPPALSGAMMDFDPTLGGAVLVGGMSASGAALNETWLYTSAGWSNLSATAWGRSAPHSAFGTVAWDPARAGLVLVDGCTGKPACSSYAAGTWLLNSTGWHLLGNGPGFPHAVAHATMAWDPTDRILVFFGGNDSGRRLLNETWLFNGTAWKNATGVVPGCTLQCYYPSARQGSLMTWDAQLGTIVMFGGTNRTVPSAYNDTWSFTRASGWKQLDQLAGLVDPTANSDGSLAENSSGTAPLLVSGGCTTSAPGGCLGIVWTLDTPPALVLSTLGPLPADAGVPISIKVNVSQATGAGPEASWLLTFGDGGSASGHAIHLVPGAGYWNFSATHVFATGGAYNLSFSVTDFFYVSAGGSSPFTIATALAATGTGSPGTTIAGYPVQFSANVSGGTPPYHYLWVFGDGGTAVGASATYTYGSSGSFRAVVTVSDGGRATTTGNVTITVGPALVASPQVSRNPVDALVADQFTASAAGGMGAPFSFSWKFGDGGVGAGASTAYTYRNPGPETVMLETTDHLGYIANTTLVVVVNGALSATVTASPNSTILGGPVTFGVAPGGGTAPYTYAWLFGDGSRGGSAAPIHNYTQAAAYTVSVWVNDSGGGSVFQRLSVVVTQPNTCPTQSCGPIVQSNPVPWALIGGMLAAIAVGIAVSWWYFRRPRGGGPAQGAKEGPASTGGPVARPPKAPGSLPPGRP